MFVSCVNRRVVEGSGVGSAGCVAQVHRTIGAMYVSSADLLLIQFSMVGGSKLPASVFSCQPVF